MVFTSTASFRAAGQTPAQTARLQLRDIPEIATVVSVPTGTVRSRLSRGRCALRRLMNESTSAAA
jgi:DNA-directed RNA polymerase specialized sigma24 family protein